jgi:hypothetical protein
VVQNDIQCPGSFVCRPGCSAMFPCDTAYVPTILCTPDCSGPDHLCRSTDCPNPTTDFCQFPPNGDGVHGIDVDGGGAVDLNGHTLAGAYYGIVAVGAGAHPGHIGITGPGLITGSQIATTGSKITGANFTLTGNVTGINVSGVKLDGVTIAGGDYGIYATRGGKAANLTVTGLTTYGVVSQRGFRFVDSTITGNGYDVLSYRAPRLTRSSCDTSARLVPDLLQPGTYDIGAPWGVCAND